MLTECHAGEILVPRARNAWVSHGRGAEPSRPEPRPDPSGPDRSIVGGGSVRRPGPIRSGDGAPSYRADPARSEPVGDRAPSFYERSSLNGVESTDAFIPIYRADPSAGTGRGTEPPPTGDPGFGLAQRIR